MKKILPQIITFTICLFAFSFLTKGQTITSISPTSGPVGTLVTVEGTDLNNLTALSIAGVKGLEISNDGVTLVGFVMPGATTGTVDVTTDGDQVSSSQSFTVTSSVANNYFQIGSDIDGITLSEFGFSVSLSADGRRMAIGAPGDNAGYVSIYENVSGTWTQVGVDIIGEANNDRFGGSVSLSANGKRVAIGATGNDENGTSAGQTRVYEDISGTWTQIGSDIDGGIDFDSSGQSVALSANGRLLAIGAPGNNAGYVHIFEDISGTWTQIGINITGANLGDDFGSSVSISADGQRVVIGAPDFNGTGPGGNYASIYENISGTWMQIGSDIVGEAEDDDFGYSVSISADGQRVAISGIQNDGSFGDAGHVRIYNWSGSIWNQVGADIDGEEFVGFSGHSVALSADGKRIAIGAVDNVGFGSSNRGQVRSFEEVSGTWTKIGDNINGENTGDFLGHSVAISANGQRLAVGVRGSDGNGSGSGQVQAFSLVQFDPFITTWAVDAGDLSISIPITGTGYNYKIRWEEVGNEVINNGTAGPFNDSNTPHSFTLPAAATYRVYISGDFPRIYFNNSGDKDKIQTIDQWGDISWTSMQNAFAGCTNLTYGASDAPDLSAVTDLVGMFANASSFNGDLNNWDVSNITNMSGMFAGASSFNGDISSWDVSNLSISTFMFGDATSFNGDLSNWTTTSLSEPSGMFFGASDFNSNLSSWDVRNVTNMSFIFQNAAAFNSDISSWNVSSVTNMNEMFSGASSFNIDLSEWDVSSVTNMGGMFLNATSFDQSLASWDLSSLEQEEGEEGEGEGEGEGPGGFASYYGMQLMLNNTGLSVNNYDSILIGWSILDSEEIKIPIDITLDANNLNYCTSANERLLLINDFNWTITDAGLGCPVPEDQASNIIFSNVTPTQIDINWTNGDGANRLVLVKENTAVDANPLDLTTYMADPTFKNGDQIENENYVAYNGNSEGFTLTGLTEGTTYHVRLFEYNGEGGSEAYNTSTATDNPNDQTTSIDLPVITDISPLSAMQGDTVTISGSNFTNASLVSFGGIDATSFTVISDSEIVAVVGAGASGDIVISTPAGDTSSENFIFLEPAISLFLANQDTIIHNQTEAINFGAALEEKEEQFTIVNTGTADLIISDIISSEEAFEVLNLHDIVKPDSSVQFTLRFNPSELGVYSSEISINNNSSTIPTFIFNVFAELTEVNLIDNETDSILISNQDVDIGSTFINVDIDKNFLIENLSSNSALEILSITVDNPTFQIINIPSTIAASSSAEFTVRLIARDFGEYQGIVTLTTNLNEFSFQVIGEVLPAASTEIKVYNVVTPNGDGRHDFLQIENITEYPDNKVSIFNRWGNRVFEITGYNNTNRLFEAISDSGEELISGNYYYVIDKGNGDKRETGFLLIKR